jgi:DNA repair photolyase
MRIHTTTLRSGITRTPEFEKKGLASYSVNVGTKCGHDCLYCSTGAILRMHKSFTNAGENPFEFGYAIIDPETPQRVAKDAKRIRNRGLVQLCTTVDAWSPEAQQHNLGRKCLEAILAEPGWTVRILTKNAAVIKDFDLIEKHKDRVLVGLSITGTEKKSNIISVIEPNASPIEDRMNVMREARERGFRTYAMFCPLLPGIACETEQIDEFINLATEWASEEIFVEPVNRRGRGLILTEQALRAAQHEKEANAISAIRQRNYWSAYAAPLFRAFQNGLTSRGMLDKLRFLLYTSNLCAEEERLIRANPQGVRWLGPQTALQRDAQLWMNAL